MGDKRYLEAATWPQRGGIDGAIREARLAEPIRPATFESDVLVPFAQALISGAVLSATLAAPALLLAWDISVALVPGVVAAGALWAVLLLSNRKLLRRNEYYRGADQAPPAQRHEYTIAQPDADGQPAHWNTVITDVDPARLATFARAILNGQSTAVAAWTGTGKLLTRDEYEDLRDQLVNHGFARWGRDRNQGWALTAKGSAWFKQLAETS